MRSVGILGGSHFIGYHLARRLSDAGCHVTLFNRGITAPPRPHSPSMAHVYGDRNRPTDLAAFLGRTYDVVFDLSGYTPSHVRPLTEARWRSRIGHYVFCSTSSVYQVPPQCPFSELAPRTLQPNTYGGDKALCEDLIMEQWTRHRWPVTILRPHGVLGPYGPAQTKFVFSRLQCSLPIHLRCRQPYKINFLFIRDLITAFERLMNHELAFGKIYNVAGDDITIPVNFINLCAEVASLDHPEIRYLDAPEFKNLRIGMPWPSYDLVADTQRIKADLDLRFTPLKEAVAETWAWLHTAPEHLEPELFRGERFLLRHRPIPGWMRVWWILMDFMKSWRVQSVFVRSVVGFLKRVWAITLCSS